jgi:beta-galactosidase
MAELGFNTVKYWVQWRWSHRAPEQFFFEDVDRLMDLAAANGLGVTLNTIFDVAPIWLYDRYPDAKQVMNSGAVVQPYTVGHRQIGGHPGPCYNHSGALRARTDFLVSAVRHFREHPALAMWDVWNEPELSYPQRTPNLERLVCYCGHCRQAFLTWLQDKYGDISALNEVWGRCYEAWEQVELPRNPHTITDFVDWREFHIDTMTREAQWRLETVRRHDPDHVRYLHVVPNTMAPFNAVSCAADDFALAQDCQVFAATMNGGPVMATQVVSAAQSQPGTSKTVYNVESHVNHGCTSLHQRVLDLPDLLLDLLPQIGLGIRGFLFWQYRPEVLGFESPAWGLVNLDGSDRPVTRAVESFWLKLQPHVEALMACPPAVPEVGIWKSRKNEIFHYCIHGDLQPLIDSVEAYHRALYYASVPVRYVNSRMLSQGHLRDTRVLILPSPYYLTQAEADALDLWIRRGGTAFVEAHLGGYDGTRGRHSRSLPGCGLSRAWGLTEHTTTAVRHLDLRTPIDPPSDTGPEWGAGLTEDVKKALAGSGSGGPGVFPIRWATAPQVLWGADRYAELGGDDLEVLGTWAGRSVIATKPLGAGRIVYVGTRLGQGATVNARGLSAFVMDILKRVDVRPTLDVSAAPGTECHIDLLADRSGLPRFLVALNRGLEEAEMHLTFSGDAVGVFTGARWSLRGATELTLPGSFAELFVLHPRGS